MNRPGHKDERAAGGCVAFFGLPFFAFGAFATYMTLNASSKQHVPQTLGHQIAATGFAALFALFGFGMVATGVAMMRRGKKLNRPSTGLATLSTSWRESPWFPKPPRRQRGGNPLTGRLRLAPAEGRISALFALFIFAIFWNGIIWGIGYGMFLGAHHKAKPEVVPAVFLGVFALVGLLIIFAAFKQLALVLFVGETSVEISQEPLNPGSTASAVVIQSGGFPITSLIVSLVCREIVIYRQGTNSVTHREEVHRDLLHEARGLRAQSGRPVAEFQVRVPSDAAPSFKAPNNKLEWSLEVKMDIPNRPDVAANFPVRIAPVAPAVSGFAR